VVIKDINEVYEFVGVLVESLKRSGHADLADSLENAMDLGSSGLEILGSIGSQLVDHRQVIDSIVDGEIVDEVIKFVDRAYGRGA
jgi:hypothetical protein